MGNLVEKCVVLLGLSKDRRSGMRPEMVGGLGALKIKSHPQVDHVGDETAANFGVIAGREGHVVSQLGRDSVPSKSSVSPLSVGGEGSPATP